MDKKYLGRNNYKSCGVNYMWFWWFMFVCNMLYSLLMIIAGRFMWKHYPAKINSVAGYRSSRSMMNKDTWQFVNENCGKRWWKIGWIMLLPTILVQIPVYGKSQEAIGWMGLAIAIVECTILLVSILPTERALKQSFTDEGVRK